MKLWTSSICGTLRNWISQPPQNKFKTHFLHKADKTISKIKNCVSEDKRKTLGSGEWYQGQHHSDLLLGCYFLALTDFGNEKPRSMNWTPTQDHKSVKYATPAIRNRILGIWVQHSPGFILKKRSTSYQQNRLNVCKQTFEFKSTPTGCIYANVYVTPKTWFTKNQDCCHTSGSARAHGTPSIFQCIFWVNAGRTALVIFVMTFPSARWMCFHSSIHSYYWNNTICDLHELVPCLG